jgi:Zn-dependent oligopeptidase
MGGWLRVRAARPAQAEARAIKEQLTEMEGALEGARNAMSLGYAPPEGGAFVPASSVLLRTTMRTADAEPLRKACFAGLGAIGTAVAPGLARVVALRNRMARALGFADYYDMKVTQAEGFGKARLFEILDGLEQRTRPLMATARARVASEKGAEALAPWNLGYVLSGDVTKAQDPYHPFEDAVDIWARSFAAMGIEYAGSTLRLDLCDRPGKYSNGFCHWPQCAYTLPGGGAVPSAANFTSLATPSAPGSGASALATLMHEGGHAAHFANVAQPSPFFSQERAPTSVAYAETQSMFLDALCDDAAWLGRYARDRSGAPMPWALVEAAIRAKHPTAVLDLRAMLAVPYFEKALYELPEAELTAENLQKLAAETEERIQGGPSPRPLLTVPHILADESSCYYQGYVLAEMAVHQTRAHFAKAFGRVVDEPRVGAALRTAYWAPGNGAAFLDLVSGLTGAPLAADAWVAELQRDTEAVVREERKEYEAALAAGPALPPGGGADLRMRVVLVHGAETIADSGPPGGDDAAQRFAAANGTFKRWVRATFFGEAAATAAA